MELIDISEDLPELRAVVKEALHLPENYLSDSEIDTIISEQAIHDDNRIWLVTDDGTIEGVADHFMAVIDAATLRVVNKAMYEMMKDGSAEPIVREDGTFTWRRCK